jgi:hypothetical protein
LVATSKQDFGTSQSSVALGQPNAGALNGVVFADLDRNGVRGAGEPGIAGVSVIIRQANGALSRQLTTDANGAYQATNLPAGDYTITALLPAGYSPTTTASTSKTVVAGANSAPAIGGAITLYLPVMER